MNVCAGSLHFHMEDLGLGIITHELFHAVTVWARQQGCSPELESEDENKARVLYLPTKEEICAEVIGGLMAQILVHCAKLNLVPNKRQDEFERRYYNYL